VVLSQLSPVLSSPLSVGALGVLFGASLAFASRRFSVKVDPRVQKIYEILPGANCGACGYPGCMGFAAALVKGEAVPTDCAPGGEALAKRVAEILGVEVEAKERQVARVHCGGGRSIVKNRVEYIGLQDCTAASLIGGGPKECQYGCLGLGDCVRSCPFDAIHLNAERLPVVDPDKCTGCGNCVMACPKQLISLVPVSCRVHVLCRSFDKGAVVRKICSVGCIACNKCNRICPVGKEPEEKAIIVRNQVAEINYNTCTSCGLCATVCPTHTIVDEVERQVAFIDDQCVGCRLCLKACPVGAITGELKQLHRVDPDKCVGCGICVEKCPPKISAIRMVPRKPAQKNEDAA